MTPADARREALKQLARRNRHVFNWPGRVVAMTSPALGQPEGLVFAIVDPPPDRCPPFALAASGLEISNTYQKVFLDARPLDYVFPGGRVERLYVYANSDEDGESFRRFVDAASRDRRRPGLTVEEAIAVVRRISMGHHRPRITIRADQTLGGEMIRLITTLGPSTPTPASTTG